MTTPPPAFIHPAYARPLPRSDRPPPTQTELTKTAGLVPLARYVRYHLAKLRLGADK